MLIFCKKMMGVVNGGETDEPEWMKDFRLKKERRAEDEKRRKEREDQKKHSIPSWKREILVKRNQRVMLSSLLFGLYLFEPAFITLL